MPHVPLRVAREYSGGVGTPGSFEPRVGCEAQEASGRLRSLAPARAGPAVGSEASAGGQGQRGRPGWSTGGPGGHYQRRGGQDATGELARPGGRAPAEGSRWRLLGHHAQGSAIFAGKFVAGEQFLEDGKLASPIFMAATAVEAASGLMTARCFWGSTAPGR